MASRQASTSSRRRFIRQSRVFPGPSRSRCESNRLLWLVGRGQHDLAVQRLDRPAGGDESAGQPVEQLGVAGPFAQDAEVAGGGDQPPAEVVLPDPVDHHARGQRVVGTRDRAGQLEPAAARAGTAI